MKTKFLCVHGHFYQPPRENPWLNEIEVQTSAYPYHDWNERITAECYLPNCYGRIFKEKKVKKIFNNYSYMNYNFGPTLLMWLEKYRIEVYKEIINSDKLSMKIYNGHGSAIAQIFNHTIMPLANPQSKLLQVHWGIKDFENRFNRLPEGMWLSETAVNSETLETLVDNGIKFTILSPYQINKVFSENKWIDVSNGSIDYTKPYKVILKNGKEIIIFVYDGYLSKSIAFDNLLQDGNKFINSIKSRFKKDSKEQQLVTMATDGETFGHHKKFGELALSYVFDSIEKKTDIKLCNLSLYISLKPKITEIKIKENSAWSCAHGVGRWSDDCGCKIDPSKHWNQKWRFYLRNALNALKDKIDAFIDLKLSEFLPDKIHIDSLKNDYINVITENKTLVELLSTKIFFSALLPGNTCL